MQELMVYAGHLDSYGKCEETIEKFTSVQVSPCQVYRVADHVSESLSDEDLKVERILQPVSKQDVLYVEIDGSMIPTRKNKEPWKEVKECDPQLYENIVRQLCVLMHLEETGKLNCNFISYVI